MKHGSGRSLSPWMAGLNDAPFGPLERDVEADVCVIGAGIAGLSVAHALVRAGKSVVVIDDGPIGGGETSRTTAHLVDAFDDRYHRVEWLHGQEGARLTAESHHAAIDEVERIVGTEGIECAFQRLNGYLFVPPGEPLDELEKELAACHRAGLTEVAWADRAPLQGFETGRCLRFPRQAQFHPLHYLAGLARVIVENGGRIFTSTHASSIEGGKDGARGRVGTGDDGPAVTAMDIVVATNSPINDRVTIHTKQYAYRTYVIGARVPDGSVTRALYWDTPSHYHYVRLHEDLLIVGGEDHKTGQGDEEEDRYGALETWARERFPTMLDVEYRWSGQFLDPADALAFIGRTPGSDERVWIVTGDSGNGMTHGVIAGMLLRDLIRDREHPWAKLYDPNRTSLRSVAHFTSENLNMAAQYADWLTGGEVKDESEIAPGTGAVIREGMHKVAVYRDTAGRLHRRSAVCPHLGAIVGWNAAEGTWDCPAHGSRFDPYGKVVNGPAMGGLSEAEEKKEAGSSAKGDE